MKLVKSAIVAHGNDYTYPTVPATLELTVNVKSRWDGDTNPISGIYMRAVDATTNLVASTDGAVDPGATQIGVAPRSRSALMHSTDYGLNFNGSVSFGEQMYAAQTGNTRDVIRSVSMLIMPTSTTTVTCGTSVLTMTNSSGSYSRTVSNGSAFLNGSAWSTAQRFPFPRLVTFTFSVDQTSLIVINGSGLVSNVVSMGVDPDEALFANMLYRKPIASQVVIDSAAIPALTDNPVTVPESWSIIQGT